MYLTNSEFHFTCYSNLYSSKEPSAVYDINQLIEIIKYGYIAEPIKKLRNAKNKEEYNNIKQSILPCITTSGIFTERNSQNLQEHSGLIQIDIDDVDDYDNDFNKIANDNYTYVAFKSPGGKGIKIIVKINPSVDTHYEQFKALEVYYKDEYSITIDSACKDVSRCLLLSYDPNIFCNPRSNVFEELYLPPKEKENIHSGNYSVQPSSSDDEEIVAAITKEIELNNVDITSTYEDWIRVGYALATTLDENGRDYFHRISSIHPDYHQTKCDRQYTNLLKRNTGATTIGTLIYMARQNGIDVSLESSQDYPNKPLPICEEVSSTDARPLFDILKEERLRISKDQGGPAFTVFTDKSLKEMVEKRPKTDKDFLNIHGVSTIKLDKYAKHFIPLISSYKGKDTTSPVEEVFVAQKSTTQPYTKNEQKLYNTLRNMRKRLSQEEGVRPYWIYGNNTINEIVISKPRTKKELLAFKGIGEKKMSWFGQEMLDIINEHRG